MYTNNTFFNRKRNTILLALIVVLSVFIVGCDGSADEADEAVVMEATEQVDLAEAIETVDITDAIPMPTAIADMPTFEVAIAESTIATDLAAQTDELTEDEAAGLLFMREEEKLARDVYLTLYDVWETAVFNNIANSEQTHMDAILTLITHYGLTDPAAGNAVGTFTNPDLQTLYDQLVATGSQSLADAFAVGAAIEEIDILDLDEQIAATTNPAILQVYGRLMDGSENHLRAFVPQWERQTGEIYTAQYMSQEQYTAIMASSNDSRGQGNNGQGNNGQDGNGQGNNGKGGNGQGNNGKRQP